MEQDAAFDSLQWFETVERELEEQVQAVLRAHGAASSEAQVGRRALAQTPNARTLVADGASGPHNGVSGLVCRSSVLLLEAHMCSTAGATAVRLKEVLPNC